MCGGVYCSKCCPQSTDVDPDKIANNHSMPRFQRELERLCISCRIPAWFLPMDTPRRISGSKIDLSLPDKDRRANVEGAFEPKIDGVVMQTVLSFLTAQERTVVLMTHPSIRHCLPIPPIRCRNNIVLSVPMKASVAFVYPGVIAVGDGGYSGNFRRGGGGMFDGPHALTSRHAPADSAAHMGTGGGGSVYCALDRTRNCFVAVKLIAKDFPHSQIRFLYDRTFATIEKEIAIQRQLVHPSIAPLHSVFQTRGHVVMVSDAGEGRTARSAAIDIRANDAEQRAAGHTGLPGIIPFTLRVIRGVVVALQYMASEGYVHRDVKLDNVILSRDYRNVRIIDFGLAEEFNTDGPGDTGKYAPLGTPSYLSPENVRAVVYGQRRFTADQRTIKASDVFSIGVMAYMMLSNKRVYGQAKDYRKMLQTAEAGIRCSGAGWESVPAPIAKLIESMLQADAYRRPTFQEILDNPVFSRFADDMEAVVQQRYDRVERDDIELHRKWSFVYDANEDSETDDDGAAAAFPAPGSSTVVPQNALHRTPREAVVVTEDLTTANNARDATRAQLDAADELMHTAEHAAGDATYRDLTRHEPLLVPGNGGRDDAADRKSVV